jgi:hypothetical protein
MGRHEEAIVCRREQKAAGRSWRRGPLDFQENHTSLI